MKLKYALFGLCYSLFSYDYDVIVIGGGLAGIMCSVVSSDMGKNVALIEKHKVGGTRMWFGDYPFNTLAQEARLFNVIKHNKFNIPLVETVIPSCKEIFKRVFAVQQRIYESVDYDYIRKSNTTLFYGEPRFINSHTIILNGKIITAEKFVITTGARSKLSIKNIENLPLLTRENFFSLKKFPKSIVIIGAGPLGIQVASILVQFGVKVTLVGRSSMILPKCDCDIVNNLHRALSSYGITIHHNTEIEGIKSKNGHICAYGYTKNNVYKEYCAQTIFVATGSVPNIDNLGLNNIGVACNEKGIIVNDTFQTTASHIYACGDIIGKEAQSRFVEYQAKSLLNHMVGAPYQGYETVCSWPLCHMISSVPTVAWIGLREKQAREKYGDENIITYGLSYDIIERSHLDAQTEGYIKFVCKKDGELCGVFVYGDHAEELMQPVVLGKNIMDYAVEAPQKITPWATYFDLFERAGYFHLKNYYSNERESEGYLQQLYNYFFTKKGVDNDDCQIQ